MTVRAPTLPTSMTMMHAITLISTLRTLMACSSWAIGARGFGVLGFGALGFGALGFGALGVAGCGAGKDTAAADAGAADSGGGGAPERPAPDEDCASLTLRHDGPNPPVVGDSWSVFLRCDDATLVGSSVLTVDPVDAATIDENMVIFREPGPCTLRLQVGSRAATLDVVVSP